jgi:hypothetical protein
MASKPHDTGLCDTTPCEQRRETRYPTVTYTRLHHSLLKAASIRIVARHPDGHYEIAGFRVHDSVGDGLHWLILGVHLEEVNGPPLRDGTFPVLLTPLGTGVLSRWDREHPGGEV